MENTQRQMAKIVKEICQERQILCHALSYDWVFQLDAPNGNRMFIYGYRFPQNSAAVEQICDDKCALSDVLEINNIPHVEHVFFISPSQIHYIGQEGSWAKLLALLQTHKALVCKVNNGSGGHSVFKATNVTELEEAVFNIFKSSRSMSVSPYIGIQNEYRTIILNGKVQVAYQKVRPFVVGNGTDTISMLIHQAGLKDIEIDKTVDLNTVLKQGEKALLSWKHNLGQGAVPELVTQPQLLAKLTELAASTAKQLDIRFASIDIIDDGKQLKILEINSGIMMENFAQSSEENYALAKRIYDRAICDALKIRL